MHFDQFNIKLSLSVTKKEVDFPISVVVSVKKL